ncbi:hypothetical protein XI09_26330 [Bradyrhizobium sp. CCBAU 11386]|nr:hypothetical protein [Bradyrhizobium sp. CCBAU 11386]
MRGPENPRARGHSPARDQREATEARNAAPAAATTGDDPAAPSGEKFKVGKYELSEAEVATMMERQALDDLRKATIPPTPDKYEAKLPADFKAPEGIDYKFDASDPSIVAARNWAHAKGLSQDDFSQLLSLHAAHVTGQEAALAERARAEITKAGVNAPQRVDAVGRWITAEVGEADAKPIRATIVTDAHLRFYEKIMSRLTSQGVAPFSQQHRVPPDTGGIPGYENMSFEQRRYAQEQRAGRMR